MQENDERLFDSLGNIIRTFDELVVIAETQPESALRECEKAYLYGAIDEETYIKCRL